jgi:4-amino-4-deoxy-L-arabinose transferase-like glycosyltransferase
LETPLANRNRIDRLRFPARLLLILCVAFAIRYAYFLWISPELSRDGCDYALLGKELLRGKPYLEDYLKGERFFVHPLYPAFIGFFYSITGNLEFSAFLPSLVFGSLILIPVYLLSKRMFGTDVAGISLGMGLVLQGMVHFSVLALSGMLYGFFRILSIYLGWLVITTPRVLWAFLCGMAFGLSYLTREFGLINPFYMIGLLFFFGIFFKGRPIKRIIYQGIVVLGGFFFIAFPFHLFLKVQGGQWTTQNIRFVTSVLGVRYELDAFERLNGALDSDRKGFALSMKEADKNTKESLSEFSHRYVRNVITTFTEQLPHVFSPWILLLVLVGVVFGVRGKETPYPYLYLSIWLLPPLLLYPALIVWPRYFAPLNAILLIIASKGAETVACWVANLLRIKKKRAILIVVTIVILALSVETVKTGIRWIRVMPNNRMAKEMGLWIKENHSPRPSIMSRKPFISFYAEGSWILTPYADIEDVLSFARFKGTDLLALDSRYVMVARPLLIPLMEFMRPHKGLEYVHHIYDPGKRIIVLFRVLH